MTQEDAGDSGARPVEVVARRVREIRRRRDLSAAQLAERLREVGLAWDRNVIANLETGRRASVDITELLALAYVLDVAPVHLLVPTDDTGAYHPAPSMAVGVGDAREWVRGFQGLPGTDARGFFFEVPAHELNGAEDADARLAFKKHVVEWLLRSVGGSLRRRDDGSAVYEWNYQAPDEQLAARLAGDA